MHNFYKYESREAAGDILAEKVAELGLETPYLLAIPRGGIQVSESIADKLKIPINPLIVKKLPAPSNPEYGFGAVTEDGTRILNEEAVTQLKLKKTEIEKIAQKVIDEIKHRKEAFGSYNQEIAHASNVIIVDDGIATGYSLIAGIKAVKKSEPISLTVAVPVSSYSAYFTIEQMVDKIICPIVSDEYLFAVANYYEEWHDLSEHEIKNILENYRKKYSG